MIPSFLKKMEALTAQRVLLAKTQLSFEALSLKVQESRVPFDVYTHFLNRPSPRIIAEVKRMSPSLGEIAMELDPVETARDYFQNGATMISVLTEPKYFGGSLETLQNIRKFLPESVLLLKDFVIDEYQVLQARLYGADAILLIYSLLGEERIQHLYQISKQLGLTPLIEVHDESEMLAARAMKARLIGVNNRNLSDLSVNVETSRSLAKYQDQSNILIAESGIENSQTLKQLMNDGYTSFLIGSSLMKTKMPGQTLKNLIEAVL